MMQRDEDLLLDGWLRYYGYLFGFENLEVFDNGSTSERVIETLRDYERAGCRVHWAYTRLEDFHAKNFHFGNIIKNWDSSGDYDFAFPLDCDEFITVFTERGLSCGRSDVHAYLDSLIGEQRALGISHSLHNVPGQPDCFWSKHYVKSFLSADTFGALDHGFHAAVSRRREGTRGTRIAYIHFHHKPFALLLEHARRKLVHFVDVRDLKALNAYDGPGRHLTQYFSMNETDYLVQTGRDLLVRFPAFSHLMRGLGIRSEFLGGRMASENEPGDAVSLIYPFDGEQSSRRISVFDGETYLRLNEDIRNTGIAPLDHYLAFGFREGRRVRPDGN